MSQETCTQGTFETCLCECICLYCLLCGGVSIRCVDSLLLYPATVQQTNRESQVGDHVQIDVFVFVSNSKKYLSYIAKCFCPKLQNVPLAPSPCSVNKHWVSRRSPLFRQKNILASHLVDHSAVLDLFHSILIVGKQTWCSNRVWAGHWRPPRIHKALNFVQHNRGHILM